MFHPKPLLRPKGVCPLASLDDRELAQEARDLDELKAMPGWRRLEGAMAERLETIKDKLLNVDPTDVGQIASLQAQAREARYLLHIVEERIRRGKEAQKRLIGKDGENNGGNR